MNTLTFKYFEHQDAPENNILIPFRNSDENKCVQHLHIIQVRCACHCIVCLKISDAATEFSNIYS